MHRRIAESLQAAARWVARYESYIAVGLFTAFACTCLVFFLNAEFDDIIIEDVVTNSGANQLHGFQKFARLMHVTHGLMFTRLRFFTTDYADPTRLWFRTPSKALLTARGGCGDFTAVLTRALQLSGEDAKVMKINCPGNPGCHIFTEARLDGKWVVLDGLFDYAPTDTKGNPMSAEEIVRDWRRVKTTLPWDFNPAFSYSAVTGTNWSKFGALSRGIYSFLKWAGYDDIDQLSIRSYVLNLYWTYLTILLVIGVPLFSAWFYRLYRKYRRRASADYAVKPPTSLPA